MKKANFSALLISALLFTSFNTQASTFNFKYTFTDNSALQGMLDGTILSDGDTVLINSFGVVQYAGVVFPTITNGSFIASPFSTVSLPKISFSGNLLNVFVCSGGFDSGGVCDINKPFFILDAMNSLVFVATDTDNPPPDFYDASSWSLTAAPSSVPVPAAAWLFGSALLGFAGLRHKSNV